MKWLGLGLWHSLCSFFLWVWLYQVHLMLMMGLALMLMMAFLESQFVFSLIKHSGSGRWEQRPVLFTNLCLPSHRFHRQLQGRCRIIYSYQFFVKDSSKTFFTTASPLIDPPPPCSRCWLSPSAGLGRLCSLCCSPSKFKALWWIKCKIDGCTMYMYALHVYLWKGYFIIPLVTCSPFQPFLLPHHIHHPLQLLGGHFFTQGKK